MNKILVFTGSDEKFKKILEDLGDFKTLKDILEVFDKKEIYLAGHDPGPREPTRIKNLAIETDEYASLNEWAINSFFTLLNNSNIEIENLFLCNPPKKIRRDFEKKCKDKITYEKMEYLKINDNIIRKMYESCTQKIIGQDNAIEEIMITVYSAKYSSHPIVILLNGESGIGKTETAKIMCECLKGQLTRIQFAMQQNNEAYNYIFGSNYAKNSLARDLIRRESNIIHIDEFDKVSSTFFNVFYQMFDEGVLVDNNYEVDLSNCIFLCTSNFKNKNEIIRNLGKPLYSRINHIVEFNMLSCEDKIKIAEATYNDYVNLLSEEERAEIGKADILLGFKKKINEGNYNNIRTLKNHIKLIINKQLIKNINLL